MLTFDATPPAGVNMLDDAGVGTIIDEDANDPGVGIAFDNTSVIVTEGDPGDTVTATFTVTFTGNIAPGETVTVDYATGDDTALDGTDYTAQTGTIAFDENTSSVNIVIDIVNDFVIEETEVFNLVLSNIISNIGVGFVDGNTTNTATGTIIDNDLREIMVDPFTEEITIICGDEIPEVPELVFFNGCGEHTFEFSEVRQDATDGSDDFLLIRTWNVTDQCGNTAVFEQIIVVLQPQLEEVTIDICIEDEAIDLINFLPESFDTNGTFEVLEGDVVLNGSLFDPLDHLPGEFKIAYSSTEGECKYFVDFTIIVNTDCVPCGRGEIEISEAVTANGCLLYTSPSPRDLSTSRMPSSA